VGRRLTPLAFLAALVLVSNAAARPDASAVTHGVVVGDVSQHSALLWARGDGRGLLRVSLSGGPHKHVPPVLVKPRDDFTGQARLRGLAPSTTYDYEARFDDGPATEGSFETPPAANDRAAVRVAFGGDVGGQNVCRDATDGYPIFDTIRAWQPDLFVGLGDMIYGDNPCTATGMYGNAQVVSGFGPATNLAEFRGQWRYNRADLASQRLLGSTGYVGLWDDHEVINDFGPLTDIGPSPPYPAGVHMLPIGRQAFLDYTPVVSAPRLYRSFRWGRNMEIFVLDTRSFRDANNAVDDPQHPKTMLGEKQLEWLKDGLRRSNATWKVIVSSVPMSIPTGFPATNGRDGWANFDQNTGFEHELLDILGFMRDQGIDNPVWITTDVHFAEAFRYLPFPQDPGFVVHELVTGPLNAGIFPTANVDQTLNPQVLFGPAPAAFPTNYAQARTAFNFGTLQAGADGDLTMQVINTTGQALFSLTLPTP
jgi:alkaline phosphatase D